ncbi:alanine-synthesizing transaminase [Quadrisphaera granulorum]|uniref:alanine transaminase n=1 Tax=Quadrisphaera granulorum TaxID=317664 RepID=A0A316A7G1_9ACTN|nr:pyridoxal phosphate-dependent aminotransferase [Quadrisphaera granulorum]PWJ53655.1 alanine-synthesizing transaminase [Quadrisphaera granulorum]SZE96699.1 alanine-synthesizing transaminase [Quadrisphaera granulorum]
MTSALRQADRLRTVRYDIRGPLLRRAREIEAAGHEVVKLNIGNPAAWGLQAPDAVVQGLVKHINDAEGYSDARGILPAREAVADYYAGRGVVGVGPDQVMLGNGVSELIVMTLQALLDPGDQVLVPSPDYPLWTGAVRLSGGTAVHYRCVEEDGWQPDVADVAAKVTPATKALVIINPNNPTGAVYSRETLLALLDVARQHSLLVLADEIYDHILFGSPDAPVVHEHAAALAPDLVVLTMCGLSKNHRAAGFRSAWLAISGPRERAADYLDGLELLANMRMCPNVPAQHAVAAALADRASIDPLLAPGGRLREQRDHALRRLNAIPGVSCVEPRGALYLFAKLDRSVLDVDDDEALVMDLLNAEHLLVTHGTGFNLPTPDHLRMVFLAPVEVLDDAADRLERFLAGRHR